MRTRFSVKELTEFERLTDEIKIAARDIAKKFHPNMPNYEPWVFDLYVDDSYITIRWSESCDCEPEEFDVRYEWFGLTDEELDELVIEEQKRKERQENYKELDRLESSLRSGKAEIVRIEKQIKKLQEQLGEDK